MGKMELIREFSKDGMVMVKILYLFFSKNVEVFLILWYLFNIIFSTSKSWTGISKPSDISKDNYDKLLVYIHTYIQSQSTNADLCFLKEIIIIDQIHISYVIFSKENLFVVVIILEKVCIFFWKLLVPFVYFLNVPFQTFGFRKWSTARFTFMIFISIMNSM